MNYIILDLEWNQYSSEIDKIIQGIPFEIIEIGAVKLNADKEIIDTFSQVIKPQIYEKMHFMTQKIVHIDSCELKNGKNFPEVMDEFLTWCGEDYIFGTWGSLDLVELQRNIKYYQLDCLSNGPIKYIDVQKLFSIETEEGKQRRSLEYAVDFFHIDKNTSFHRALADAHYAAVVFQKFVTLNIEKNVSYDVFVAPMSKKEEIHVVFDNYSKYISREFQSRTEAMNDREVVSTICYICKKAAKKKVKWFSNNGKHYYCLAYCKEHGFLKGKIRIKRTEENNCYVIKTLKLIEEENVDDIMAKKEKVKILRSKRKRN